VIRRLLRDVEILATGVLVAAAVNIVLFLTTGVV
jgi:hypothetical protein